MISKIAELCLSEQLASFINVGPFTLHPMQFSFRAHHSAETASCFFLMTVRAMADKRDVVGAVFLDLRKAFDTVSRHILITKLSAFNFTPLTRKWIESYLNGRNQHVSVSNHRPSILNLCPGVPQGSILGCFCLVYISMIYHRFAWKSTH